MRAREPPDAHNEPPVRHPLWPVPAARPAVPPGLPCTKPPWGVILAVDTATAEVKWEVPLGTVQDLAPVPLPIKWGTPNLGGPIVTGVV
jgi:glucose dehydrogenase